MSRLADLFLEPAACKPGPAPAAAEPPAELTAVLAPATDLVAVAGGVAAAARRAAKARNAVVLQPAAVAPRTATPSAAALARRLDGVGAGTLCHIELPLDPGAAAALVHRIRTAAGVPLVLALPKRLDGFDPLLAGTDRLVLALPAHTAADLADLALASLALLGPPASRTVPPTGFLTTRAAALGLVALPPDEVTAAAPGASAASPGESGLRPASAPQPAGFAPPRHPEFAPPQARLRA